MFRGKQYHNVDLHNGTHNLFVKNHYYIQYLISIPIWQTYSIALIQKTELYEL